MLAAVLGITAVSALSLTAAAHAASPSPAPLGHPAAALSATVTAVPGPVRDHSAAKVGSLAATQELRLVLGIKTPHPAEEKAFLAALQTKGSPEFHRYLTAAQWNARFAPSPASEQSVVDWAEAQGLAVTGRYADRLVVDVAAPASTVERVFKVSLGLYSLRGQVFYANATAPTLPSSLHGALDDVEGLDNTPDAETAVATHTAAVPIYKSGPTSAPGKVLVGNATKPRPTTATTTTATAATTASTAASKPSATTTPGAGPAITNGYYDPSDIYSSQAYNTNALDALGHCCNPTNNAGQSPAQSSIALAIDGSVASSDITGFHNQYPYLAYATQPENVDGGATYQSDEGTLDTEWSMAMANSFGSFQSTAKQYLYEGPGDSTATYTDIYNNVLSQNVTRTLSISYAWAEGTGISAGTMSTDDGIFSSLVGQGWTVLAASGDHGSDGACDGGVSVMFPASDPNVIAVGGTQLEEATGPVYSSEVAWSPGGACTSNNGGSTGGCSAYFSTPSWQSPLDPCGSNSRAVPDYSLNAAVGQNIYYQGALHGVGGTSVAAPEMAGFTAQADAYQLFDGYGPLGNYAAALWRFGQDHYYVNNPFYDITSGCNYSAGHSGYCAGTGYDLVTGWGSVNMLQLAWALNWNSFSDDGRPVVSFSGPATNAWYNTNQAVTWTIADTGGSGTASGVAGFTQAWDGSPYAPTSEPTPGGPSAGGAYYSGPQFANGTSGFLNFTQSGVGCHTANVLAFDNMGLTSGDQTYGPICYDNTVPTGSILADNGAYATNNRDVSLALSASDQVSADPITSMRFSSNGSSWGAWESYNTSAAYTLSATNGYQDIYVEYENAAGTVSGSYEAAIYYDTVKPTVVVPKVSLALEQLQGTAGAVTVSWTGSDSGSGVRYYTVKESQDGGAFSTVSAQDTQNSLTLHVPTGHSYQFRVNAVDYANNVGAATTGATKKLTLIQQNGTGVSYSSGWKSIELAKASAGSLERSSTNGAKATFVFKGSSVALVTDNGPTHGQAKAALDGGTAVAIQSNRSAAYYVRVLYAATVAEGTHTLVITNTASGAKPIFDVDAFLVLS